MRLIDADKLKKEIHCAYSDDLEICEKIDEQSTAYDLDKVVEELETDSSVKLYGSNNSGNYMIPVNKAIEIVKQGDVGTETETIRDKAVKWNNNSSKRVPYEFIDYVEGKREIGVSDDVCEWKSVSDGEFIQNPHTKRLYSNEPSIKNVYCNTCGKKIRIVGD